MDKMKQFYLRLESEAVRDLFRCSLLQHLDGIRKSGIWLVQVDPPIPNTLTRGGDEDRVVLVERFAGDDLKRLGRDPMAVHVCQILAPESALRPLQEGDLRNMVWGWVALQPEAVESL